MIASCHVVLQTSRNEGTPVALIQAMAAGRPFISTAVGGIVDMVEGPESRDAEGSQWFLNAVLAPATPDAFVSALGRLVREPDLILRMGEQARALARARYRKEALAEKLDQLYRRLAKSRKLKFSAG